MSGAKKMLRTFIGLWPDAGTRMQLADRALTAARLAGGRPTRSDTLHLTLVFLGSTAAERVTAVAQAMDAIDCPAFDLQFDRSGWFRQSGVAWLGMQATPDPLAELQREVSRAASRIGFSLDVRPYVPHLTLARDVRRPLPDRIFPPLRWRVDAFTLIASELSVDGPRYRHLHEASLGGPGTIALNRGAELLSDEGGT